METILTNQRSADSSKNTTAQNKSDDAAKRLSKLGDSLNELSKSSKSVTQINAGIALDWEIHLEFHRIPQLI